MTQGEPIDITQVVDEQRVGAFHITLLALSTLIMTCDGFDMYAAAFAAPELVKQWHIAPSALGPMLTASVVGLLFGGPLLGYWGDRFGRRKAILVASLVYGGFSLLSALAGSPRQLTILRFVTGLGLGGVIPNIIALNAEFAPRRIRAACIVVPNFGIPIGGSLPGIAAAVLVPRYGWQVLFLLGGIVPILASLLTYLVLPESAKYLVLQKNASEQLRRVVRKLSPAIALPQDARFIVPAHAVKTGISPTRLFVAGLAAITTLLWLVQGALQIANFFLISWLPLLLHAAGSSASQTAVAMTLFQVGGIIGGALLMLVIDRFGVIPVLALFALGAPVVAAMGTPGISLQTLWIAAWGAGFCMVALNFGMNAIMGMVYPTPVRSIGAGWTMAVGRIGSIAGSLLGGVLLGMKLSTQQLFFAPAAFLVVGTIFCTAFLRLCMRRFHGYRLGEAISPVRATETVASQAG